MGRRGPAPAPTAVTLAKGETRPSRVNYEEPLLPAASSLAPPSGLSGSGLKEWRTVAPLLAAGGVLKDTDLAHLEDYCRALNDLRKFEAAAKRAGAELAIAKGYQGMVVKLRAQCSQLRQQLGMTPSSRTGVKADKAGSKSADDDRFFGGPRVLVRGGKT